MLEKIETKINIKKLVRNLLIAFFIAQPILDIYMSLFDAKIQIVGVSLATIIRFLWVFVMVVLTMILSRKRKNTKLFILYCTLVLIYTIFHHINAIGFSVKLVEAKYSMKGELFYLARMCIPSALIYIIYNVKLNYKNIKSVIISVSLIISITIILTNIFKVSFVSYSLEQDYISGNIIEWFTKGISIENDTEWVGFSARGWFQSSNQLSGLMVILVPVITYIALKENKVKYWIYIVLHIISMLCLTTRVGALGGILVMLATIFVFILEKAIHKQYTMKLFKTKNFYCIISAILVIAIFFSNSPFKARAASGDLGYDILNNKNVTDHINQDGVEPSDLEKIKYIEENEEKENINTYFSHQVYPYTDDVNFWYNLLVNVPEYERAGSRKLKSLLTDRIIERDNRFTNHIVGISFTTASSFVWPERDFETQLDSLGIVGFALFVGPYISILLFGIYKFFKKFKDNLYLSQVVYMIAMVIGFVAAYSSGHVLNEVFPFTFLALVTGIVLNISFGNNPEVYEKEKSIGKYFEKIYPDSKDKFYSQIKEDLLNENKKFVVTANPETIMIAEKNEKLKKCLLQDYVTIIPDGIGIIKGAKILGYPQKETITGIGLVEYLLGLCNENKKSVFFFGAKPEVIDKLTNEIKDKYPNLKISGMENGYVEDKQKVFEKINKESPDLILIALGIPKQELLIDENFKNFNKGIFIGVGGSFDVLSGTKKRAPSLFIKLHLEWLYRILSEPKRIKRFFDSNVKYLFEIAKER